MCKRRTDAGQALVVVALGMVILLSFLGLGIDLGYLRLMKRRMQMVADAAALAGAQELTYCTTNNCSTLTTAAQKALDENGFTGSALVTKSCSPGPPLPGNLTIIVNNPPCYLGATDPHSGDNHYVEVLVSQQESAYFSRIFGVTSRTVSARAEATLPGGSSCVFALDPTGTPALTLAVGDFTSQCGVVDESKSTGFFSPAFFCLFGIFDAPYIGVVGTSDWLFCNNGGGANPKAGIKTPNPADPLAYLQGPMISAAPPTATCGTTTTSPYTGHTGALTIGSAATLNSGTYCGGITLNPGANVTFNPGVYTLNSTGGGGGLTVNLGTNVTANGVAFYNYGPSGGINFICSSCTAGAVNFTAPTSGPFGGILFFQDPGNTSSSTIIGSVSYNTKPTGAFYFPSASITFALDILIDYDILVAKDITFGLAINGINLNSQFYNDYSSLVNGTPIKNNVAVLAE